MRRAEFLKLTGLSVDNHKNLVRRDLLPVAELEESPSRPQGWTDYDPERAFMTLLSIELAKAGTDQQGAKTAVALGFGLFRKSFGSELATQEVDIWFGSLRAISDSVAYPEAVGGPMDNLLVLFSSRRNRPAHTITFGEISHQVSEISMVNVSRLLRQFRQIAVENGIAVDFEWLVR